MVYLDHGASYPQTVPESHLVLVRSSYIWAGRRRRLRFYLWRGAGDDGELFQLARTVCQAMYYFQDVSVRWQLLELADGVHYWAGPSDLDWFPPDVVGSGFPPAESYRLGTICSEGHRSFHRLYGPVDLGNFSVGLPFVSGLPGFSTILSLFDWAIDHPAVSLVYSLYFSAVTVTYDLAGHRVHVPQGRSYNWDQRAAGMSKRSNRGASGIEAFLRRVGSEELSRHLGGRLPY